MGTVTLDQVLELAKQLSLEEQRALKARLPVSNGAAEPEPESDQEWLDRKVAELKALRESGAPLDPPLKGTYYRPELDLSFETLQAEIRQIRDQWKEDFDDLDSKP